MPDTNTTISAASDAGPEARKKSRLAPIGWLLIAGIVAALAAELFSRVEDRLFAHIPFLSAPGFDDLFVHDELGRRGRPYGHFKKWRLNEFGFRAPQIDLHKPPGCIRIVVMGASETFGLYESPDHEYSAILAQQLAQKFPQVCTQVINTAVVGMTLGTMIEYWHNWVSRFSPDIVLLYPSPNFYLSGQRPQPQPASLSADRRPAAVRSDTPQLMLRSRFVDRLRDVIDIPRPIQLYRNRAAVEKEIAARAPDWLFREPPTDRLDWFGDDLAALLGNIQASGAHVVLLTHAMRATLPPRQSDLPDLWTARVFVPRAENTVMIQFDRAANAVVARLADRTGSQFIDTAAALNGCAECFGDLVHFTDLGAKRFADTVTRSLDVTPR